MLKRYGAMSKPVLALVFVLGVVLGAGLPGGLQAQNYDPQGRIDPFLNLPTYLVAMGAGGAAQETAGPIPLPQRPPGLPGLYITELSLRGVMVGSENKIAILRGADNFTYMAREGFKLFDGFVETITDNEVVFVREIVDARGNKSTQRISQKIEN